MFLTLPLTLTARSLGGFLRAFMLSFLGVVLPLFVFFFSLVLTPDSKSECDHGWLECFYTCKLILTPLALLATAALYALEVLRVKNRTACWIVMGTFLGAIIASVCLIHGLICLVPDQIMRLWLLVPLYVAIWYSWRGNPIDQSSDIWQLELYRYAGRFSAVLAGELVVVVEHI